jgi:hypothetical protein
VSRGIRLQIELKQRDRQQIDELLGGGLQAVRTTLRALALRQLDHGQSTPAVGANLGLSAKAVWQIGKRYLDGGLERAVFDAARPGRAPALDQQQQQRIIAAVLQPNSLQRTVFLLAITKSADLYVSAPILQEYVDVLGRPELAIRKGVRQDLVHSSRITATSSLRHVN